MTPAQRTQVQKKFIELMDKACDESFKKYLVSKTDDGYRYHDFILKRTPDRFYDCYIGTKLVFEGVSCFELAISMCYNYLFKRSENLTEKMHDLNKHATKHKIDLSIYSNRLNNCSYEDYCSLQARIVESKTEYDRIVTSIRCLTKAL